MEVEGVKEEVKKMKQDGTKISFWNDIWVGVSKLKDQFPSLFRLSSKRNGWIADMGVCNENGLMEWDLGFSNYLNEYENIQLQTLLSLLSGKVFDRSKEDVIQWVHSVDKVFTVAEGIRVMLSYNLVNEVDWLNIVWNKFVPTKIAIFHWQTIQGGVPVKEVLGYRRCLRDITDDKCGWCLSHVESIDHLFLHCSWSHKIWSALFNWWNVCWIIPSNILEFSLEWSNGLGMKASKFWKLIGPVTLWAMWLARNELVFNGVYLCGS
ncbi:uncharacterized protein [Rutidosis leptorrhynchoides]|uniref:uncharacterized protein n=1 Tax=Rutidosis leptorrhynchoides TaxID=125765 RepID=UPI003A999544